jgi:hypothetical protein
VATMEGEVAKDDVDEAAEKRTGINRGEITTASRTISTTKFPPPTLISKRAIRNLIKALQLGSILYWLAQ